ncbi:response regulator [Flavobacterium sp. RHBU_24]|uniref:hybrid sensor histidine kinase/response regulator n=1 Tax=Flavobacterium sp. RHBU_24 TaxID=3391185 RepID=UPI003984BB03
MNTNFRRNLLVGFSISFLILIVTSVMSFISIRNLLDSNKWVDHTQRVIYNLNNGHRVIIEAQTSMRGYLLTGREEYLGQYSSAEQKADSFFNEVENLTLDNTVQQRNLAKLSTLRAAFFTYLRDRIEQKKRGREIFADDLNRGSELMADMRNILLRTETEETALLKQRTETSSTYGSYSMILIVGAALISLLISGFYFTRIMNDYRQRALLLEELRKKDKETADRISAISSIAEQISAGEYDIRVNENENDALGSVSFSLNNMAKALKKSFTVLSDNEWEQTGIAELNNVMIGEKSLEQLCRDVVDYVAGYTAADAAAVYVNENDLLQFVGGYSFVPADDARVIRLGDGIIGQAALSGKMLQIKDVDIENVFVSYTLGQLKPTHIIALPLTDSVVEGTMGLISVKGFSPREVEFIEAIAGNIGIALRAAQNRKRVQELLEETQAQGEELRAQHSELEGMNAELETQTEKLQASEEELRVQQEELQQINEELAERSTLLEERNLEIQKKSEDLEISTRYKSEFLANMSHELRTPLNSILLLSRLLSENTEDNMSNEQIEFARVINSSGNGLLGLIDEILDLSKIEAGKMDLEFADVAVNEITDNLKGMFSLLAREKDIAFNIDDKNAPLVLKTDKMRLEQILKNLISNAIKFTAEGSVTVEIKKDPENAKRVSFTVRDTGIGIPREKQPLIFEAFQQADGSTKRKYGGTGLGLSISRELAKLLNGTITLQSEPDKGSAFTLTIPIYSSVATQPVTVSQVYLSGEQTAAPAVQDEEERHPAYSYLSSAIPDDIDDDRDTLAEGDKTILIVEDDVNFAKTLLDFARKRGYKAIATVRGDQALNLALAYKPVGVLLDIELPVKSGWEVMEELKGNSNTKHIPVHIMSSHKLKKESMLKGAVNFLDKPVAYEQIPDVFKRIEHFVNREAQKVLIIEDNPKHAQALAFFLESYNINSEIKSEINDGVDALQRTGVDCVILDMGVPDRQAYDILESVKQTPGLENLPVIVFTGKSLSMKEELKIKKYADSIIVKTAHSYQRMLDEVSLFLHLVEENKNKEAKGINIKKQGPLNNILSGKTVLVVDDDVRNIFSLTKSLEAHKMNVITAIDGKEALGMLEQHPEVNVVLLDMMMPNMDGYETATRIRQNEKLKGLPVIAVTAKAMTGDREKCINAGASDYITKPVDIDQLLSLLRVWLYDNQ